MPARTNSRLRQVLKKVQKPQTGWLDLFPAVIGKSDGTILTGTNGLIHVRNILNGQDLTVYNFVVPNRFGLQVEVGRRVDQLGLWQVKGALETFDTPAGGTSVPYHAEQHQFPNGDTVYINRKQITALTVLVSDAAGFIVRVYGAAVRTATGIAKISTQAVDLSTYVPATGAVFVSIESDDDGALTVNEGAGFASPAIATVADIPVPAVGKYMLAFILLWGGMEELKDDQIVVPMPLAMDYSLFENINLDNLLDVNAPTPSAGDVLTWDEIAEEWVASNPAEGHVHEHELLMEDGVTFPPVPLTNEDGTDWMYAE